MTVRPAAPADVQAVAALERELFGPDAWSADAVAAELASGHADGNTGPHAGLHTGGHPGAAGAALAWPRRHAVVAEDGRSGVVGYAVVAVSGEVADLERVGVARQHRRAGLARTMLAPLRRWAGDQGATRMLLEVAAGNRAAITLYESEGFTRIDRRRRYYRDGGDALVLALPLGAVAPPGAPAEEMR